MTAAAWDDSYRDELSALASKGLLRRFRSSSAATMDGQTPLQFGSNNYLGLSTHPRVVEASVNAAQQYGAGSTGSRLLSGNHALNAELERELADFKQTEDAVVFSSGYTANIGAVSRLFADGDLILSDALNHASLIDGCRLSKAEKRIYPHRDAEAVEQILRQERGNYRRAAVITDGVFSVDGDLAPLPALVESAERWGAAVYLDDAHGFGVLGKRGRGTAEHFNLSKHPSLIKMGTLSKALGSMGGYVCASAAVCGVLRQGARSFAFTHGLPPSALAAALESLRIMRGSPDLPARARSRARRLRACLKGAGFQLTEAPADSPVAAVLIGEAERAARLAERCFEKGLYAPAIRPPTVPPGSSRLRMSVMATHTDAQIDEAAAILTEAAKEERLI